MSLPNKFYFNKKIDKKFLEKIIIQILNQFGLPYALNLVDSIKTVGFRYATNGGISLGIDDLKILEEKKLIMKYANKKAYLTNQAWRKSLVTDIERFQTIIDNWNNSSESLKNKIVEFFKLSDPLNNLYMISFSGARGNISQVRQLIGMRGLMSDQKGQIINFPIVVNFREGLSSTDYIVSSYGARKGVVDTALRTADSGYLTRKLVEIGQEIIIRDIDCNTDFGILVNFLQFKNIQSDLKGKLIGYKINDFLSKNTLLNDNHFKYIKQNKIESIYIRSPLTCSAASSICQYCYGWNLAYHQLVALGDAIGIIAAQSIGEPGTQMTMRTFHTGGVFTSQSDQQIKANISGILRIVSNPGSTNLKIPFRNFHGEYTICLDKTIQLKIQDWKNEFEYINIEKEAYLQVQPNTFVKKGQVIANIPTYSLQNILPKLKNFRGILSPINGEVFFDDLKVRKIILDSTKHKQSYSYFVEKPGFLWILEGYSLVFPKKTKIMIRSPKIPKNKTLAILKLVTTINYSKKYSFINNNTNFGLLCSLFSSLLETKIFFKNFKKKSRRSKKNKLINLILTKYKNNYLYIYFSKFAQKSKRVKLFLSFYIPFQQIKFQKKFPKKNFFLFSSNKIFLGETTKKKIYKFFTENGFGFYIPRHPWIFKLSLNIPNNISSWKMAFPGETLFNKFEIKNNVIFKVLKSKNCNIIIIFPIYYIQQSIPLKFEKFIYENKKTTSTNLHKQSYHFFHGKNISLSCLNKIFCHQKISLSILNRNYQKFLLKFSKKNEFLYFFEKLLISPRDIIASINKGQNKILFNKINDNYQQIEAYTILGYVNYKSPLNININNIKYSLLPKYKEYLITKKNNIKKFFSKESLNIQSHTILNDFKFEKLYNTRYPLFLHTNKKNTFFFKSGYPFFLTKDTIIKYDHNTIIKKKNNFAILVNFLKQTDDIVQGLPKIQQLLELRGELNDTMEFYHTKLIKKSGIVFYIGKDDKDFYEIKVISGNIGTDRRKINQSFRSYNDEQYIGPYKIDTDNYVYKCKNLSLTNNNQPILKKNGFVYMGQPITKGLLNPHELLRIFISFYIKRDGVIFGIYRGLHKLRQILLNSIQAIYKSQGIGIANKHFEIIIRQMTRRVQIVCPGESPLTKGEACDLHIVEDLCFILFLNKRLIPFFKPKLIGITRSSLNSSSFLSSSSFQETRKVLAKAAIEGKTDWLRTLKANIITGRLLPAGSGFNKYKFYFSHPEMGNLLDFFEYRYYKVD